MDAIERNGPGLNNCHICDEILKPFLITPLLECNPGEFYEICESCADTEFPGWKEDDEEIDEEEMGED